MGEALRQDIESKMRRKANQLQAKVGVTVTSAKVKRPNKKRKEEQRAEYSNLELLVALGFPADFVKENHKLGLKEQQAWQRMGMSQDQLVSGLEMFGAEGYMMPVKKQLGVEVVDDNFNFKHYKIPAVKKKHFPEDNLISIPDGFPAWA